MSTGMAQKQTNKKIVSARCICVSGPWFCFSCGLSFHISSSLDLLHGSSLNSRDRFFYSPYLKSEDTQEKLWKTISVNYVEDY